MSPRHNGILQRSCSSTPEQSYCNLCWKCEKCRKRESTLSRELEEKNKEIMLLRQQMYDLVERLERRVVNSHHSSRELVGGFDSIEKGKKEIRDQWEKLQKQQEEFDLAMVGIEEATAVIEKMLLSSNNESGALENKSIREKDANEQGQVEKFQRHYFIDKPFGCINQNRYIGIVIGEWKNFNRFPKSAVSTIFLYSLDFGVVFTYNYEQEPTLKIGELYQFTVDKVSRKSDGEVEREYANLFRLKAYDFHKIQHYLNIEPNIGNPFRATLDFHASQIRCYENEYYICHGLLNKVAINHIQEDRLTNWKKYVSNPPGRQRILIIAEVCLVNNSLGTFSCDPSLPLFRVDKISSVSNCLTGEFLPVAGTAFHNPR